MFRHHSLHGLPLSFFPFLFVGAGYFQDNLLHLVAATGPPVVVVFLLLPVSVCIDLLLRCNYNFPLHASISCLLNIGPPVQYGPAGEKR